MKIHDCIFRYLVFDGRYHSDSRDAEAVFASDDLEETKQVADEAGCNFLVVEHDLGTGFHWPVHDCSVPRDLGLPS